MNHVSCTLERISELSSTTREFRFVSNDGAPIRFEPGQFFRFTLTDDKGEFERSYSLCNVAGDLTGAFCLDLVVSRVEGGRATDYLFACETGIQAKVTGPYGRLVAPDPLPRRLIMVATSVGLAPFLPITSAALPTLEKLDVDIHLLFGVRDPSEFLYADLLAGWALAHPHFHLDVCYSRKMPAEPREFEFGGYVHERIAALTPDPTTDRFLLCGNPQMIDEAFAALKVAGFTGRQVVREKYVFAREKDVKASPAMTPQQQTLLAEKMKKFAR